MFNKRTFLTVSVTAISLAAASLSYWAYQGNIQQGILSSSSMMRPQDFKGDLSFFNDSEDKAKKGDRDGMLNLAAAYIYGIGTNKNTDKALEIYEQISASSDPYLAANGKKNAGWLLYQKYEIDKRAEYLSKAINYMRDASVRDPGAKLLLGIYLTKTGREPERQEGTKILQGLAEQGSPAARRFLTEYGGGA